MASWEDEQDMKRRYRSAWGQAAAKRREQCQEPDQQEGGIPKWLRSLVTVVRRELVEVNPVY